jgi:hypothetical protein
MAKNSFSRYIWLIDLLNRRGYAKMEQINEAWRNSALNETHEDMPERTFFNHRDAISQIFGIDILYDREVGYHIPTAQIGENNMRAWMLQTLSVNNMLNECTDLRERILFEEVPSVMPHLQDIINIMRDGNAMNLTYQSYRNEVPYTFLAHPYCLKMFKQRWYLLAKTPKYGWPTIYALDRIKDVEELDIKAEIPKDFNAKEYFSKFYGIITGDGNVAQIIKLKVRSDQAFYFRSLPLHHSQEEIETTDEYAVFKYYVVPSIDFIQEILSHGDAVVVLEPGDLANEMKEIAQGMVDNYCD